jgi:hypothetical protein
MQVLLKNISLIFIAIFLCFSSFTGIHCYAEETQTLHGYVQEVPNEFFGTWRVSATRIETDSPARFKEKTIDLWNIIEYGNVIKLSNPFSGASAQIEVKSSEGKRVEFSKTGKYDNQILTDTVSITIIGDKFTGTDTLKLDTLSELDGSIRKSCTAQYKIVGERIAGQSIIGD